MPLEFHTGGRLRRWLGARLGGDFALGDRAWRRIMHCLGSAILLYYVLPHDLYRGFTLEDVLFLGLTLVLILEALRWIGSAELPTIREYEQRRVASYVFFAVALVAAVVLFPEPIAVVVILGTAFVDPLIGELRLSPRWSATYPWFPLAVYVMLGAGALVLVVHLPAFPAVVAAGIAGVVALAVERPRIRNFDDDIAMTLVPGVVLLLLAYALPMLFPLGKFAPML